MTTQSTKIYHQPTSAEIEREVENLIVPETADENAASLVKLIYAITDFENPEAANLAQAATEAAYRQTSGYRILLNEARMRFVHRVLDEAERSAGAVAQKKSDEPQQTDSSQVH